jgi:hypothetical protein
MCPSANYEVLHSAGGAVQQHRPELFAPGAYSVLNPSTDKVTKVAEQHSLKLRIENAKCVESNCTTISREQQNQQLVIRGG